MIFYCISPVICSYHQFWYIFSIAISNTDPVSYIGLFSCTCAYSRIKKANFHTFLGGSISVVVQKKVDYLL